MIQHRPTISLRRIALAVLLFALAAAQFGAPLAQAQVETEEINQERARRDDLREQQVELAKFLDPLLAEDSELEERLRVLEENVRDQQLRLGSVQQSIAQAEADVTSATQEVAEMRFAIDELKHAITRRAIEAYVHPQENTTFTQVLASDDITQAGRRQALLDTVGQKESDLLDALRGAEDELDGLVEKAQGAVAAVEQEREAERLQLLAMQDALAAVEVARVDLDERVADVIGEIDGYADAEAQVDAILASLVAAEEARLAEAERQRLAAERQRQAQERARIAALTVTPAEAQDTGQPTQVELVEAPPPQAPAASGGMGMPVNGVITSSFGPRWGRMHNGIDIAASTGTGVFAALGGTVVSAGANGGFGNMVMIDHGNGTVTLYAHLSSIAVSQGSSIGQGGSVGQVGCTGSCTGPHLHFEVRVGGVSYDPMQYIG